MSLRFRFLILSAFLLVPSLSFAQGHVTCASSPGGRRVYCQADTRGGVALVRPQGPGIRCRQGIDWDSTPAESGSSAVALLNSKCTNIMAGHGGGIRGADIVRSRGAAWELAFIETLDTTGRISVWRAGNGSTTCRPVSTTRLPQSR